MGVFDKFLDVMRLSDEDDDYLDDDYEEEEPKSSRKRSISDEGKKADAGSKRPPAKITPLHPSRKGASVGGMEVTVIKPTSFEDAREVAETLLQNHTVILNMEGLDLGLAQRIIDFTSGACYAIDGTLQKISNYIFILTPASVDISGDLQGIMDAFDFSGIQTGF